MVSKNSFYLQMDIKSFFTSIDQRILYDLIARKVKSEEILWLARTIIFHDCVRDVPPKIQSQPSLFNKLPRDKSLFTAAKGKGLPIGNLTSQFFANVYLNELDQFAKHKLKAKYYLRYVDDFLLISSDREQLKEWHAAIVSFLKERLCLELNLKKQILQKTNKGIDWLGYIIKPDHILVRRRIVKNFKRKLFQYNQILKNYSQKDEGGQLLLPLFANDPPLELIEKMLATVNSYFGHFKHADTFKLRTHLWENRFQKLRDYIEPKDPDLICLQIKPEFLERAGRAR